MREVFLWKKAKVHLVGLITKSEGIRRARQWPFTEARFEKRPCLRTHADQRTVSICVNLWNLWLNYLCALVPLWLKMDQSKQLNYAKQTQFSKKSNVYNLNNYNELQRKINNGHLVKTNPNKANLWWAKSNHLVPSAVEESIKTTSGFAGLHNFTLCTLHFNFYNGIDSFSLRRFLTLNWRGVIPTSLLNVRVK